MTDVGRLLAGVDEAGYGPLMGPLVTGCSAFDVPEEFDLRRLSQQWKALDIEVGDSKKIYSQGGLKSLERMVLPFLSLKEGIPERLVDLLDRVGCDRDEWKTYPWYSGGGPCLPYSAQREEIEERIKILRASLMNSEVSWAGVRCRSVYVGEFNRRVKGSNKGWLLARISGELLQWAASLGKGSAKDEVQCDRQGGRKYYGELLQYLFDEKPRVLEEGPAHSEYILDLADRKLKVSFTVDGDANSPAVGLASMVCKYVRELHMSMINAYWLERYPHLEPTAGYYEDGKRFLEDIDEGLNDELRALLVRSR